VGEAAKRVSFQTHYRPRPLLLLLLLAAGLLLLPLFWRHKMRAVRRLLSAVGVESKQDAPSGEPRRIPVRTAPRPEAAGSGEAGR
jgi:hypothetical protein